MNLLRLFKRKPSVREVSLSAIPTQTIAKDREQARLATINGLRAAVAPEARERFDAVILHLLSISQRSK